MKKVFCDRHPDRPAVATFRIREIKPVGMRPIMLSYDISNTRILDLCDECTNFVRPLTDTARTKFV